MRKSLQKISTTFLQVRQESKKVEIQGGDSQETELFINQDPQRPNAEI